MISNGLHKAGVLLAYLWAGFWTLGPLAASWPHLDMGFMLCLPGAAALAIVHSVREQPTHLGALLLALGTAIAILAESRIFILTLGAAPPLAAGFLLIISRFLLVYHARR